MKHLPILITAETRQQAEELRQKHYPNVSLETMLGFILEAAVAMEHAALKPVITGSND